MYVKFYNYIDISQTYEELCSYAEQGDHHKVDTFLHDLAQKSRPSGDPYDPTEWDNIQIFSLEKTLNRGNITNQSLKVIYFI